MTVKLGSKMRDNVSGFEGVAVSTTTYLNGCVRICLQPSVDKDGKLPESQFFDEEQLAEVVAALPVPAKPQTGGDRPLPRNRRDAPR